VLLRQIEILPPLLHDEAFLLHDENEHFWNVWRLDVWWLDEYGLDDECECECE
jgi:hypothetical protein